MRGKDMAVSLDDLYQLESVNGSAVRDLLARIEVLLEPSKTPAPGPKAATQLEGLTKGPERIIALFGALEKSLVGFGNQVAKFVALASPISLMRWNQALADMQAVIGKALVPVLESATAMVRKLGDAFASLSPEAKKLTVGLGIGAGLGGALSAVITAGTLLVRVVGGVPVLIGTLVAAFVGIASAMDGGKNIAKAFGSVIKSLSSILEAVAMVLVPALEFTLVPALETLAEVAKTAADNLKDVIDALRSAVGLDPLKDSSSVGAAVRNPNLGSVQEYANKAYKNAYMGGNGPEDEAKKTNTILSDIREILRKSNPLRTPEDSWASTRSGLEGVDRSLGGSGRVGRGVGTYLDTVTAPVTAPARLGVEALRRLFS